MKDLEKIDGEFMKCYQALAEFKADLSLRDSDERATPELLSCI